MPNTLTSSDKRSINISVSCVCHSSFSFASRVCVQHEVEHRTQLMDWEASLCARIRETLVAVQWCFRQVLHGQLTGGRVLRGGGAVMASSGLGAWFGGARSLTTRTGGGTVAMPHRHDSGAGGPSPPTAIHRDTPTHPMTSTVSGRVSSCGNGHTQRRHRRRFTVTSHIGGDAVDAFPPCSPAPLCRRTTRHSSRPHTHRVLPLPATACDASDGGHRFEVGTLSSSATPTATHKAPSSFEGANDGWRRSSQRLCGSPLSDGQVHVGESVHYRHGGGGAYMTGDITGLMNAAAGGSGGGSIATERRAKSVDFWWARRGGTDVSLDTPNRHHTTKSTGLRHRGGPTPDAAVQHHKSPPHTRRTPSPSMARLSCGGVGCCSLPRDDATIPASHAHPPPHTHRPTTHHNKASTASVVVASSQPHSPMLSVLSRPLFHSHSPPLILNRASQRVLPHHQQQQMTTSLTTHTDDPQPTTRTISLLDAVSPVTTTPPTIPHCDAHSPHHHGFFVPPHSQPAARHLANRAVRRPQLPQTSAALQGFFDPPTVVDAHLSVAVRPRRSNAMPATTTVTTRHRNTHGRPNNLCRGSHEHTHFHGTPTSDLLRVRTD